MRILELAIGNWFSRAYLIGVAVVAAGVTYSLVTWDQPDANLAAVWLLLVTLPFSYLGVLAPESAAGAAPLIAAVALGAFVNAVLIGAVVSRARRHPAR